MAQQQPQTGPAGGAGHPDGPAPAPDLPPRVAKVYGEWDLATVPAFAGGFINFGYWAELGT
ncbi:hypothetical protein [Streptomyces endophytica]|uniref:Uncharacterized protein n=1 Tax=Streptomyces endophytica TaxID=2991496 RepID=A0ABY6PEW1_9ACTN|nr:hypothetical protein [Streptomyces endophytica]UZJ31915.1 hypothetical protein OJ254_18570 [Streptomyces endophytica]